MRSFTSSVPIGSDTSTSTFSGSSSSSILPCSTLMRAARPGLDAASCAAKQAMPDASTAYTTRAPACAAKRERMPLPQPTSITALPAKSAAFSTIALW